MLYTVDQGNIKIIHTNNDYYNVDNHIIQASPLPFPKKAALNDYTWEEISQISQAGLGPLYFDIGDCKEITLNGNIGDHLTLTNQKLCVFILDFNHAMNGTAENNIIWGGFKSALTNGVDVALVDAKYNSYLIDGTICFNLNHWGSYNYGGWKGSDFRYDILGATSTQPSDYGKEHTTSNIGYDATAETLTSPKANTLLAALPLDLRNVIRLWTRWVDAVGNSSNVDANIKATVDAITLLAEAEIFAGGVYANRYEPDHLSLMSYYEAGNSRIRYRHDNLSAAIIWWVCSPYFYQANRFCYIYDDGKANNRGAAAVVTVAPAFKT